MSPEPFIVATGTPDDHGLELERIEDGLYGLTYTGFWGCKAWCYVAVAPDAAVFCQSLDRKNGATGTSITNIWDQKFILAVAALEPIGYQRPLYEYYFDKADRRHPDDESDDNTPDISRVTYRPTDPGSDPIKWEFTGKSFAEIVGRPEPDFRNLAWGQKAAARCRAHNKDERDDVIVAAPRRNACLSYEGRRIRLRNPCDDRKGDWQIVPVKVRSFDAGFRRGPDHHYIGRDGGHYWLSYFVEIEELDPPIVYVDGDGTVSFENGRHRYAALRDAGRKTVPVIMDAANRANAERWGYLVAVRRPATAV